MFGLWFQHHQIVEIEATLHVLELALDFAIVERDRRNRRGPGFGEIVDLVLLRLAALFGVHGKNVRRPGLGTERDFKTLIERERRRTATLIQVRIEGNVDGENGRERHDEHRSNQRHAALMSQ